MSTVSKAKVSTRAIKRVQSHALIVHILMLLVIIFRAVVVDCSSLKPCWCSA